MPTLISSWRRAEFLARRVTAPGRPAVLAFIVVVAAYYLKVAVRLPHDPIVLWDSQNFLKFVDFAPPGYFLFLSAYKGLTGGLAYLPHAQLALIFLGASVLGLGVATVSRNILAAYFVVYGAVTFPPSRLYAMVMSDPVFGAIMAAGAGVFIFYCAKPKLRLLALASALFALSAVVRSIGMVLPVALLLTLGLLLLTRRADVRALGVSLGAMAPVFLAAALFTWSHTGEFRIGATGGVSIFGKALMVATPLTASDPLSKFNWIVPEVRPAQVSFAKVKDPVLQMLTARQYYEHLRWNLVFPAIARHVPQFDGMNLGQQSQFVQPLARAYIHAAPAAYAKLVALDYAALWTVPHRVTTRERNALLRRFDALGDMAFLREGEKLSADDYRWVVGRHRSRADIWSVRLASVAFFFASAGIGVLLLVRRSARLAASAGPALLLCAAVHGSFLGTALNEAGLERYAVPSWPLILALLPLIPMFLRESFRKA